MIKKGSVIYYCKDGRIHSVNGIRNSDEVPYTDAELELLSKEKTQELIGRFS